METKYLPGLLAEAIEEGLNNFRKAEKMFGDLIRFEISDLEPGTKIKVNKICKWNDPDHLNKEGVILMTNGRFCMVGLMNEDSDVELYRCEDVIVKLQSDDSIPKN